MNQRSEVFNSDFLIIAKKVTEMGLSALFLGCTKTGLCPEKNRFFSLSPTIDSRLSFDDVRICKTQLCAFAASMERFSLQ